MEAKWSAIVLSKVRWDKQIFDGLESRVAGRIASGGRLAATRDESQIWGDRAII
jgi:hypothetical protein